MTTCRICLRPLTAVSDDPDLSHPSCAPADPPAFEAATHGPRTYRGVMRAVWPSRCVCGSAISECDRQWLRDTDDGRRWVCPDCADSRPSEPPRSAEPALSRVPVTPAGRTERHGDQTNASRRAA